MSKKTWIVGLALALVAATALADVADARRGRNGSGRKCPRGYEDIGGRCVPDPTPGIAPSFNFSL